MGLMLIFFAETLPNPTLLSRAMWLDRNHNGIHMPAIENHSLSMTGCKAMTFDSAVEVHKHDHAFLPSETLRECWMSKRP